MNKKIQSHNNLSSPPPCFIVHMQIMWETKAKKKKKKVTNQVKLFSISGMNNRL